jgi:hypothetical protein
MYRAVLLLICICMACNLSDLMATDNGGQGPTLESRMFLAATHGYDVSREGIVSLADGSLWQIWPDVRQIA